MAVGHVGQLGQGPGAAESQGLDIGLTATDPVARDKIAWLMARVTTLERDVIWLRYAVGVLSIIAVALAFY